MSKVLKKKIEDESGQAVIETALVLPIILMLIMLSITLSMYLYSQIIVTMSASNGARVGAYIWTDEAISDSDKREKIKVASLKMVESSLAGDDRRFKIEEDAGMLMVTVEYDFKVLLPFSNLVFDENTVVISHTSHYYVGEEIEEAN